MFCQTCGAKAQGDGSFCGSCGSALFKPRGAGEDGRLQTVEPRSTSGGPAIRESPASKKRGGGALFLGATLALLMVAAVAGGVVFFMSRANSSPPNVVGNTTGNIGNGGLVAQQGDWVYYRSDDRCMRMRSSDTARSELDEDVYLNVVGDWVYYTGYDADINAIYKARINGKDETRLASASGHYFDLSVVGDWAYYIALDTDLHARGIYKMRTDGTKETELVGTPVFEEDLRDLNVVGDWMYYVALNDTGIIYRVRTDGTEKMELFEGAWPRNLTVVDDWMYYVSGVADTDISTIYKIRTDGTKESEVVTGESPDNLNVVGNWIYYVDQSSIYRIRTDGTAKTKLASANGGVDSLSVVGDWVYYPCDDEDRGARVIFKVRTDGTDSQEVQLSSRN